MERPGAVEKFCVIRSGYHVHHEPPNLHVEIILRSTHFTSFAVGHKCSCQESAVSTHPSWKRSAFARASSCFRPSESDLEMTAEMPAERASFTAIH